MNSESIQENAMKKPRYFVVWKVENTPKTRLVKCTHDMQNYFNLFAIF